MLISPPHVHLITCLDVCILRLSFVLYMLIRQFLLNSMGNLCVTLLAAV